MGTFTKIELWSKSRGYLFIALFLAVVILGVLYVCFMNLAVLDMAERNGNIAKISETERITQNLETIYMAAVRELDLSRAETIGLVEAVPSKFVQRQKTVAWGNNYGEVFR